MNDHNESAQPTPAWGDAVMPVAGAQRHERVQRLQAEGHDGADTTEAGGSGSPSENPLLYSHGRPSTPDPGSLPPLTTPLPQTDTADGNWAPLLGPGNEAMESGLSPAPRGYTGGAMGRTAAGLSPSFPAAARGDPPEFEDQARAASEVPGQDTEADSPAEARDRETDGAS